MKPVFEIRHYVSRAAKHIFDGWLSALGDRRAQAKIATRINQLAAGNFGDCKTLSQGVSELRTDWGPGYRAGSAESLVLGLCGSSSNSNPRSPIVVCRRRRVRSSAGWDIRSIGRIGSTLTVPLSHPV
jgi:putative addiction module killer protein